MKVIVIGGGAAGMMAAISSSRENNEVVIIEKNDRLGRKLLITGKGRCNITNGADISEFIGNTPGNGRFLYSAFNNFTNRDIIEMLENEGVKVKEERGKRIFPISDRSQDVLDAFMRIINKLGIKIYYNSKVTGIETDDSNKVTGVKYLDEDGIEKVIKADKVILATGGKTYPLTGSTGDGYEIAKNLGHTITRIRGSLIPLTTEGDSLEICKNLQGLSLRNVKIKIKDLKNKKTIYEDFGEMLFTHFGVSGPTILSASAYILRFKDIDTLLSTNKVVLTIDLKPALDEGKLDDRILRDFEEEKNKAFKNSLDKLLPQKMIGEIIKLSGIDEDKKVNSITKEERSRLVRLLKNLEIVISGFRPVEEGIITAGGISIKEINPKTMESKLVKGLYFAGEIIDVDAYTGGFNLQIAYSTGYTAGLNNDEEND